jgi:hypothetical protein
MLDSRNQNDGFAFSHMGICFCNSDAQAKYAAAKPGVIDLAH